ncbi:hypothetical protein KEU06_05530 [Pseudaminobacter sp. 19-2017]|uniref:Uncharacterized protein n=1 Tax=Pseudaminobacter soli (ex Zhang et al. 2022) TaxID=2831468 RepID=A0A942DVW4_9HYPH|nr:hypothetical protein [Pseudaminobacter soli]MBS3648089.1 hypothetical protein [Pseudaminobacter soli]
MRASEQDRLTPGAEAEEVGEARAPRLLRGWAAAVFSLMSLALAVLMAVTLYFSLRSVSELSALEGRLFELGEFEKRISARVDLVNNGVQAQIEKLSSKIGALSADARQIQADLAAARHELELLAAGYAEGTDALEIEELPSGGEVRLTAPFSPAEDAAEGEEAQSTAATLPTGSQRFQRTVGPDGKVTYSRIR